MLKQYKQYNTEELKKLQKDMLAVFKKFDELCQKHNINYFACGGTLLGAIRHKGYIPWDDDVDLGMLREDYEKFLNIPKEEYEGFGLYAPELNPGGYYSFVTKFYYKDSRFILPIAKADNKNDMGIFVEIFPFYNLPDKESEIKKMYRKAELLKAVYAVAVCDNIIIFDDGIMLNVQKIDYVIHLASNTHPVAYATEPISTITTNIIGTNNLLDFAFNHNSKRFVFASSNEVYGENRGDKELFDEGYCGYIDCNTLRAGYPESKRCGEALCQAYIKEKDMDVVIARFTRSYGPTMLMSDTKAISQFIKKALNNEDIVLKSAGNQYYSYTYVTDAVSGLLTVLLCGKNGEAYNISDSASDIKLKDLAQIIAETAEKNVVFELPDEIESSGYSKATKARIDATKLCYLGWKAEYDIKSGINRTVEILKNI